jgi:prolyl-tRNA synthetase
VPLRVELGPRDLEAGHVLIAQRVGELDEKGRPVKETVAFDDFVSGMPARLDAYHDQLLARAQAFLDDHRASVDDWDSFAAQVAIGFADALHCGSEACEEDIKAETSATPRCIPTDGAPEDGACVRCGEPSAYGTRVVFARAY